MDSLVILNNYASSLLQRSDLAEKEPPGGGRLLPSSQSGGSPIAAETVTPARPCSLITSVLPTADKDQRAALYECIRVHIVTLRGCKTGSKVIWLLHVHPIQLPLYPLSCVFFSSDRMRARYGY
ncbi:hypothetical protein B0H13DRAFT_2300595 [Mycena leptocephala]|nr:hypothetical protein B0H13DRAFT_2300595 [Mycena leptocephala]